MVRRLEKVLDENQNNLEELLLVMRNCDGEMLDGMHFVIPMTWELYTRTVERLKELGAVNTLGRFLQDFREFGS